MADAIPNLPHLDGPKTPQPGSNSLIPVNTQIVTWENGLPLVKNVPMFTKAQVSQIAMAAATQLYEDPNDALAIELGLKPSEFYGKTNLEVMLIKQMREAARTGDSNTVETILNRLIGAPDRSIKQHTIVESYEDALKRIAQEEALKTRSQVIDAETL